MWLLGAERFHLRVLLMDHGKPVNIHLSALVGTLQNS